MFLTSDSKCTMCDNVKQLKYPLLFPIAQQKGHSKVTEHSYDDCIWLFIPLEQKVQLYTLVSLKLVWHFIYCSKEFSCTCSTLNNEQSLFETVCYLLFPYQKTHNLFKTSFSSSSSYELRYLLCTFNLKATSVTRLSYFWTALMANFHTKVAQLFCKFRDRFKNWRFNKNCLDYFLGNFW